MVSSAMRVTSPGVSRARPVSLIPRLPPRASRSPRLRLSPAVWESTVAVPAPRLNHSASSALVLARAILVAQSVTMICRPSLP